MINIKGLNINIKDTTPPDPTENVIQVIVNFSSIVAPVVTFADMKYNKNSGLIAVKDDGTQTDGNTVMQIMHGGLAVDGNTYPGYRYGDGCGNDVDVHYTYAINTNQQRDTQTQTRTIWADYINAHNTWGDMLANHSRDHGGYDKYYEVKDAEITIFNKTGQRVRAFVIPTADEGYAETAPYLGYKMVGSAFGVNSPDDNNKTGNMNLVGNARIDVRTINLPRIDKFLFTRFFYDNTNYTTSVTQIKKLIDWTLQESIGGVKKMGHWFSHGISVSGSNASFVEMWDYIWAHPSNNDSMWFPSMQEFSEYYETKLLVNKTETLVGNTLTISLDISDLRKEALYQDMSLIVSGGTISSITVQGADSHTHNNATGLVNIFKKNTAVKDPSTDPIPPRIVSAKASGNNILITYDRAITQTVFASAYGNAYTVTGNTIVAISGTGVNWIISCTGAVTVGGTFDYRMQRGNAQDINGLKVCTYIGYPIT